MRGRIQPLSTKTAPLPRAQPTNPSNSPVTGLKNACSPWQDPACPDAGRKCAALGLSSKRAIPPPFTVFLPPLFARFTLQNVISRTSSPAPLRVPPTFVAASHQNAPAVPPLAHRRRTAVAVRPSRIRSHKTRITSSLIYGTGIKKLRKPTPINEYKLLIYGKPRPSIFHPARAYKHHPVCAKVNGLNVIYFRERKADSVLISMIQRTWGREIDEKHV